MSKKEFLMGVVLLLVFGAAIGAMTSVYILSAMDVHNKAVKDQVTKALAARQPIYLSCYEAVKQ